MYKIHLVRELLSRVYTNDKQMEVVRREDHGLPQTFQHIRGDCGLSGKTTVNILSNCQTELLPHMATVIDIY